MTKKMIVFTKPGDEEKLYVLDSAIEDIKDLVCIKNQDDFDSICRHTDIEGEWEDYEGDYFFDYWDGNNWKSELIDNSWKLVDYEKIEDNTPDPAFYFKVKIKTDKEEIELVTSNTSGSITPYWIEDKEF